MTLSIVIPVYNGERTLPALLESLAKNECRNFEIVVVDDGSTDRTADIARSAGATLLSTGGRKGPAVGRNIGGRAAKGDVLLFLDADTLARANLVGHVVKRFADDPKLVALVGYYDKAPLNPGMFARYKALMVHHWFAGATVMESFETCCGAIRKAAFEKAGGFDESYDNADVEDYEFGWRVTEQGPIHVDHEMIVGHNFPSFSKNASNYFRRARLWMRLYMKRGSFESTATTGDEGAVRLVGAAMPFLLLGGIVFKPLLAVFVGATIVYAVMLRKFLSLMLAEEGEGFMIWGVGVHSLSSVAAAAGAALGVVDHFTGARR